MNTIERAAGGRPPTPNLNHSQSKESSQETSDPGNLTERLIGKLIDWRIADDADTAEKLIREFRRIKRPLIENAFGIGANSLPDGNVIMITSALPDEGKTFTAINLALSISLEKDLSVCLVDADSSQSGLTRQMGLAGEPGLMDILVKGTTGEGACKTLDIPRVRIVPSGQYVSDATEFYSSRKMRQLIAKFKQDRELVIIDSPPLLSTTEGQVISKLAGQLVCVVKADSTTEGALVEALELLDESKPINLVLNQRQGDFLTDSNGYYDYTTRAE